MNEKMGEKRSLALGTFDGLHLGHREVLRGALDGEGTPGVVCFVRSPSGEKSLLTEEDRDVLLKRMGFSLRIPLLFEKVRNISAKEFAKELLFKKWSAGALCCGEDFRFGAGARGDVALLRDLCASQGVKLTVLSTVRKSGEKISSSLIRRAVEKGNIPLANSFLGRPFGFSAKVIHGNHLGTGMGTPTINQVYPPELVLPRFGVYAVWCRLEEGEYFGVCNIGVKPTVGSSQVLAETWIPGFSGDLYGKRVRLFLLDFIRPERRFPSLDALRGEILQNAEDAQSIAQEMPLSRWEEKELLPP